ncbi:hypothetical protein ACHAWF_013676 [Thalassiosira exigua]
MTSFLIWRGITPDSLSRIKFPPASCDMLVPFGHALWNYFKGGSDTVTRFTWNCLPVLFTRMPQTAVVSPYFMIYSILFYRLKQNVTGTKQTDIGTLIQSKAFASATT